MATGNAEAGSANGWQRSGMLATFSIRTTGHSRSLSPARGAGLRKEPYGSAGRAHGTSRLVQGALLTLMQREVAPSLDRGKDPAHSRIYRPPTL